MSIEREDGPIKHYRMVCDSCGKQTKRFADGYELLPGWREEEGDEDSDYDEKHYCPKCSSATVPNVTEIIPNIGDSFDVSDHELVYRPLKRQDAQTLTLDMKEAGKLIITSKTPIKVEQHED